MKTDYHYWIAYFNPKTQLFELSTSFYSSSGCHKFVLDHLHYLPKIDNKVFYLVIRELPFNIPCPNSHYSFYCYDLIKGERRSIKSDKINFFPHLYDPNVGILFSSEEV